MTKRKLTRRAYEVLDLCKVRLFVQRVALKICVLEIEDED